MKALLPGIAPRHTIGIIGGGQLGRMLAQAAQQMGYPVLVLDPDPACPAAQVADWHLCAAYDDTEALAELAANCAAITTEFENVPASSLARLAESRRVAPASSAVMIAQDRILEKRFLSQQAAACGVAPVHYQTILGDADLELIDPQLLPGILKSARLGYDGKGQQRVANLAELRSAFQAHGKVACVLEALAPLAFELSVTLARAADGTIVCFPAAQNLHRNGILLISEVPGPSITTALQQAAQYATQTLAQALDYCGVLCAEFFVLTDGRLLINEIAPRPHNSAHFTQDACSVSQFGQHIRALTGLPLASVESCSPVAMLNLLGDCWLNTGQLREPRWDQVLAIPGAHLHLYGKQEARPGRKMGHINFVAPSASEALARLQQAARLLGIDVGM